MKTSALVVFRHGSTALNKPGEERVRGWSNVRLSPEGEAAVERSAQAAKEVKLNVTKIVYSDLVRTAQTAKILHKYFPKAQMVPSSALRTWDTGHLEGKLVEDVLPVLKFYFEHPKEKIPFGETYKHFYKRFHAKVTQAIKYLKSHLGEVVIFVTHSYGVCALEHVIRGGGVKIDNKCSVPPGMPVIVEFPEKGKYKMIIPIEQATEQKA